MSSSAAAVAFPVITSSLNTSLVIAGWILTAYQLVQTIVMPLAGKISEVVGKRTSFITHTLLFSVGSILCALSPNVYWLIGSRVLQAIGGGGFMPSASGIVSEEFPEARQRYIGLFSSIFPIGTLIGPILGGWMVEAFGWRSIFWFNVPLGIVILVLSLLLLPSGDKKSTGTSIDFVGAGLLLGSLSAFMFSITALGKSSSGIPWVTVGALFALGIGLLVLFLRWERRREEPIIDLALFTEKPFLAANAYNVIYGIGGLAIPSLIPLYAVSIYSMSTLQSGLILIPKSVGSLIFSIITSFFLVRWGYRRPILLGTLAIAAALVLLALQPHGIDIMAFQLGATPLLLIILGLYGIGIGIAAPAANNACIELMPDKVATIVGLRGMFRNLGSAGGIVVATLLIHTIGDVQRAFYVVLLAPALVVLISIPTIFIMPASANVSPLRK
ncbi:MAG: MFS transporter [Chloroflexi bacterium]|nr:MFS transporter [Chloroflexota bacterium]